MAVGAMSGRTETAMRGARRRRGARRVRAGHAETTHKQANNQTCKRNLRL